MASNKRNLHEKSQLKKFTSKKNIHWVTENICNATCIISIILINAGAITVS